MFLFHRVEKTESLGVQRVCLLRPCKFRKQLSFNRLSKLGYLNFEIIALMYAISMSVNKFSKSLYVFVVVVVVVWYFNSVAT